MSDGTVVIATKLDNDGIKKGVSEINNIKLDKVVKQLDNVSKSIDSTSKKIDSQKAKLETLKKSYENATDTQSKNKIAEQMTATEKTITSLEGKLVTLGTKWEGLNTKITSTKSVINGLDGEFKTASESATKSINNTTKSLDTLKKKTEEVSKATSLTNIGENITKAGDKISGVGTKLTMGVTVPLVGIGLAAEKVGMDFDAQMSRVKAISGATGEDFTKLKDQALQLGKDTAFSSKQAAEGMENLASAGFTTKEIMTAMPGMLNLAASSGESLATSSDIAASTLRGFGLAASDAGHVADVLAKNASATNAQVSDTGEALKYVATNAHAAGWGLEETTAAIGDLSNYGVKGSQAGTTLREMLVRLASPSKEAAGDMKKIGFSAFDTQGKMKSLSTIVGAYSKALEGKTDQQKQDYTATIFGQEAMSGMLALVQGGTGALDDLTNSYKNSDGAAADMAKTMQDNAKSAIEQMTGSLETAAIKVEEDFAPMITELANYIQDLANKFADLSPEEQEFYAKLLAGAAILGPVTKLVGGLTNGIGGLITVGGNIAKFLAPSVVAETALGAEAATATGFLGGLGIAGGVALGGFVALGVGLAAVITHNELMSKSINTSTDDLNAWEKVINSVTGNTIKSKEELQATGLVYKDFGDNIGNSFKNKVEASTKAIGEFSLYLSNINLDGVLTDSETADFNARIDKLATGAIETIKSRQSQVQAEMSKMFLTDDNTLDDTEKLTLQGLSDMSDTEMKQVTTDQQNIHDIYTNAIKERGHLTEDEKKAIKDRYTEISQIELAASEEAKTAQEKSYAKHDFTNRANNISADDGSTLLKDQRAKLDEQQIKDKTTYDVQIDQLKEALTTESGEVAAATQKEIDKFTEKKNKVAELEKQQWEECIKTIEEQNPALVGVYNKYTGDILTSKDKEKQGILEKMKETYTGLTGITESGMYSLKNVTSGTMQDVYVTVDKTTGDIVSAYGQATGEAGGYTQQMATDTQKSALDMSLAYSKVQQSLADTSKATVNASGEMVDQNGRVIAKLGELQTETDGTSYRILNLNGTPIKIETNADGTVQDLNGVKQSVDDVPSSKTIAIDVQSNGFTDIANKLSNIAIQVASAGLTAQGKIANNYTGTNGGDEGLSYINEHGWEISSGANEIAMLGSGSQITDHMTSVNEMNQEISSQIASYISPIMNTLVTALGQQSNKLSQVASNTSQIVNNDKASSANTLKALNLNSTLASNLVDKMNGTSGTFSGIQTQLDNATYAKSKANNLSVDDNQAYIDAKAEQDRIDNMTSEAQKALGEETYKIQKDSANKATDLAKKTAELDITIAKQNADEQVKIANDKKDKLTKIAEATTTAIKAQLEEEKTAAEKVINDELTAMETTYNNKVASIEKSTTAKTTALDEQISALEQQSTDTSRSDTRTAAKENISMLTAKMNNTASVADKRSYALKIKDAKTSLSSQEDAWNIEDEKAALEAEKTLLQEKATAQKEALSKQYEAAKTAKEAELKKTDEYYSKLLETDSLNAQTRYTLLTSSNDSLVTLLNSYAPNWQNAGQTLGDSLLTGLNSSKQSVQDAVSEMVALRSSSSSDSSSSTTGYATGTSYNSNAGLYNVDELGWETSNNSNSVAYVSKGAAINNHMQSVADMKAEIASQVSAMKNSILASQSDTITSILGNIASNTTNSTTHNDNGLTLHIENYHQHTSTDPEQLGNELNAIRLKKQTY